MEICILKFDNTHDADEALEEAVDFHADRHPWLHAVGVVRRPPVGKISIRATVADDDQPTQVEQDDLGYLIASLVGRLPRGSSALVLVATAELNDLLVEVFEGWEPEVVRHDVEAEVEERLHTCETKVRAAHHQEVLP